MTESGVGVATATTRQNAGTSTRVPATGSNWPAETWVAAVTRTCGIVSEVNCSHDAACRMRWFSTVLFGTKAADRTTMNVMSALKEARFPEDTFQKLHCLRHGVNVDDGRYLVE